MKTSANRLISEYKRSAESSSRTAGVGHTVETSAGDRTDIESIWRRVDAGSRRFGEAEEYSGILAESPNLSKVRNAYLTYCKQKDFPRADRVKLISCILKGPALTYWHSHIDGRPEFNEIGAILKTFESHFDTPAHQRQIESLALSLKIEDIKAKCSATVGDAMKRGVTPS